MLWCLILSLSLFQFRLGRGVKTLERGTSTCPDAGPGPILKFIAHARLKRATTKGASACNLFRYRVSNADLARLAQNHRKRIKIGFSRPRPLLR